MKRRTFCQIPVKIALARRVPGSQSGKRQQGGICALFMYQTPIRTAFL